MTDGHTIKYDCAIIGGGLAGLSLSIQLARQGHKVILFEKHKYPFHKVCGEYVSNESFDFLERLGLPLREWQLPQIDRIGISSEKGFMLQAPLRLGGFGISRYKLDYELSQLATTNGVTVYEHTKVTDITEQTITTNKGCFEAQIIVGAFGKSNPVFAKDSGDISDNYIGVKYHIRTDFPANRIELHNFDSGYCGISRIEDEKYCLCYIAHSRLLKANGNSIKTMEEQVLKKNPFLKSIFSNAAFIFDTPVTISNIKFDARKTTDSRFIYIGDAAGCISPLTGNGMSMAMYTSFVLAQLIDSFLTGQISREQLTDQYSEKWSSYFLSRIRKGKQLQYLFGKKHLSDIALRALNPLGKIKSRIIESTHGVKF